MTKPKVRIRAVKKTEGWRVDVWLNGTWALSPPAKDFPSRREAMLWAKNWCFIVGTALLEKAKP